MTIHAYKDAALSALALTISTGAALGWAVPAQAASDYLLQLNGVPGESKATAARHKGWIELESVQLGAERTAGGANVASGDINGGGATAASGQATGKRQHAPVRTNREASAPSISERKLSAGDTETAALLLPAVQKVREAAARMTPWTGCAAGQRIGSVTIKQKSTGKEGNILDPVVVSCATESVSFNFTKIEWK